MWRRDLLFLGVCAVGAVALAATLAPERPTSPAADRSVAPAPDIKNVVAQVDRAFADEWRSLGVEPAQPADELLIARRLALALVGAVPSLEELRALESLPRERMVDAYLAILLADRRSSDYLAERFARAYVGVESGPFLIYRRRRFVSWLADELYANRPYDALVRELITSTGLWTSKPATNFITVTIDPADNRGPDANRLAARTARAFLGMRLDCAECHDHPFADWTQQDFQGLAAFYANAEQGFTGIYDGDGPTRVEDGMSGEMIDVAPAAPFRAELLPADGDDRRRLARWVTASGNPAFARAAVNRVWAILFGRPLVEPIDDLPVEAEIPPALVLLADDFAAHGYDLRRLITAIASTRAFRLDSRVAEDADPTDAHVRSWAVFPLTRLRPEQVAGAIVQSSTLETIDHESHVLVRLVRAVNQAEFVDRYGDAGADEFVDTAATIPQRLLLMNGQLLKERTEDNLLTNAASRIAALASDDAKAVETAYLCALSRRPTPDEAAHFASRLDDAAGAERRQRLEDIYWTLLNSTEYAWNH